MVVPKSFTDIIKNKNPSSIPLEQLMEIGDFSEINAGGFFVDKNMGNYTLFGCFFIYFFRIYSQKIFNYQIIISNFFFKMRILPQGIIAKLNLF